ncbi:MAG: flagellar biosynthetic protein FliO [Bacillota bacterium]|nr:flagellar biosynthetic protein FliO [Bacillota bacterium]
MLNYKKSVMIFLLLILALLGTQQSAFAEPMNGSVKDYLQQQDKNHSKAVAPNQQTDSTQSQTSAVGVTFWDFVRMIFATIFVIALLYFLLKFINKKNRMYKSSQLVENLGGTSLGANRSIQIIKVGSQLFVVGVGESIQLLKEIDDQEEQVRILSEYNNKMEQTIQPSDIVTKIVERTKNWQSSQKNGATFSTILKNQLEDLTKGRKKIFDEMEKKGSDKK